MIIAEIGTSHQGSKEKAMELLDKAVLSGADAVKFQWVYADEILHPKTGFVNLPTGNIPLYERFKQLECPLDFYKQMCDYAHKKGVLFICSPFGLKSLKELLSINPDAIKIASPELNHFPLLKSLQNARLIQKQNGKKPIPVIISSGVSKLRDIEATLEILGKENVTLLHCITSYPAPEEEYNVRLINTLHNIFGIEIGLSDHSLDPVLVPSLAISQGATVIEKHITLQKDTNGLDDPVALNPEQFYVMCHAIHQCQAILRHYGNEKGKDEIILQMSEQYTKDRVEKVLGSGIKTLAKSEEQNYGRTNRSLHYTRSLKKGEVITKNDIAVLRTEKVLSPGISPKFYEDIIGNILKKDVDDGSGVKLLDFMEKSI